MKISAFRIAVVVVVLVSGGCRQPDGVVPPIDEETANRIGDAANDLRAAARGEVEAKQGFVDDFLVFIDEDAETGREAVRVFTSRLSEAVVSVPLQEEMAQQIARSCWNLIGVTDLSERQVTALQEELRAQLVSAGLPQDRVDAVIAGMPAVQQAVTTRPRRWYQVF